MPMPRTGDGAGILTQIPYKLFRPEVEKMGYKLFQDSDLGVGMMFLPNDPYTQGPLAATSLRRC